MWPKLSRITNHQNLQQCSYSFIKQIALTFDELLIDYTSVTCGAKKKAAFWDLVIAISDCGQHSSSIAAPKDWNELPDSLASIRTVDSFKSALETFLFNSSRHPLTTCHHRHPHPCNSTCYSALKQTTV